MLIFREISIWRRLNETSAIRYSCVQDVRTNLYAVQSADFFKLPINDEQLIYFSRQFVELFIEVPVRDRCSWHATIEEAIEVHDLDFS